MTPDSSPPAIHGVVASDSPSAAPSKMRWLWWHWLLPLLLFAAANVVLIGLDGDRWIADHLYAWEGGRWALRDNFVVSGLFHEAGRSVSIVAWLCAVAMMILACARPGLRSYCVPLIQLVLSVTIATAIVSVLKHVTGMDCPWDLQRYGGSRPYIALFAARPAGLKASGCFPAGHASGGYAWVALYFFFLRVRPRWRWFGLGLGLAVGTLFGVSQQLRGAHFLSHDLWTLMICWTVALLLYRARVPRWTAGLTPRRDTRISRSGTHDSVSPFP